MTTIRRNFRETKYRIINKLEKRIMKEKIYLKEKRKSKIKQN